MNISHMNGKTPAMRTSFMPFLRGWCCNDRKRPTTFREFSAMVLGLEGAFFGTAHPSFITDRRPFKQGVVD